VARRRLASVGPRPGRIIAGLAVACVSLLGGWAATVGRLPRVSDLWPLDMARPGGWLVDRQLRDLRRDQATCRRLLAPPHATVEAIPDHAETGGCGWSNAVRLSVAGGVRAGGGTVTCELAAALSLWLAHVVQPRAVEHLGNRVAGLDSLGTYACRTIRGNPRLAGHTSQHASANAMDVRGFVLAGGRRVSVARHWGTDSPEGRFLAAVHAGACRYFRVAIGPAYNAAHRDHFHLDRGPWHACR
jgi:hypothetical protein